MITADRFFGPIDAARAVVLRRLGPVAGLWARRRADRVAVVFAFGIVTSLALAVLAPQWSLALGPIVFGVPHILADARYLVARPGYHRRLALVLATVPPLLIGVWTADLVWAAVATAGAAAMARGSGQRKAIAFLAAGALLAASLLAERMVNVFFTHAHNFIGIGLWWVLRPRGREVWPLLAFLAVCGALLIGVFDPLVNAARLPPIGAAMKYHSATLGPHLDLALAMRVAVFFAFAQSVHYVVWLRLIPEDARERTAPRPFASSWSALARDLGPWLIALFLLAALAVVGWALVDLARARAGYLRMAVAHAHIELVAAALFFIEGVPRPVADRPADQRTDAC